MDNQLFKMAFDTLRLFQNADQIEGFLTKRYIIQSDYSTHVMSASHENGLVLCS